MQEYIELIKAAGGMGSTLVLIFVIYRLLNKWAGPFLAAQQGQASAMSAQAAAMTSLASAVQSGQGEQREVLLAVRAMASKLDDVRGWVREIDEHVRVEAARQ